MVSLLTGEGVFLKYNSADSFGDFAEINRCILSISKKKKGLFAQKKQNKFRYHSKNLYICTPKWDDIK